MDGGPSNSLPKDDAVHDLHRPPFHPLELVGVADPVGHDVEVAGHGNDAERDEHGAHQPLPTRPDENRRRLAADDTVFAVVSRTDMSAVAAALIVARSRQRARRTRYSTAEMAKSPAVRSSQRMK